MRHRLLAVGFVAAATALAPVLAQTPLAQTSLVGDEAAGEAAYTAVCRTCHGGLVAPTLRGVPGRPIAGVADFSGYSAELKAKGGETWTDANLDAFLKSPAEFAPGTLMTKDVPEDQARADIIAFLKTLPPPR